MTDETAAHASTADASHVPNERLAADSSPTAEPRRWDAIVIGGASAGLSAALMLGRARRNVLVLDGERPRNGVTSHLHGLLGHDGKEPAELYAAGSAEVASYGVTLRVGNVAEIRGTIGDFAVHLASGEVQKARRLIVATGLRDDLLAIPGLADQWGRSVFVCPYCDGYERRDRRIGIIATGQLSRMQVQMLRQWSADVVYLPHEQPMPDQLEQRALDARGIELRPGRITQLRTDGDRLLGVDLADGSTVDLDVIFTMPPPMPNDELLRALGAERHDTPYGRFVTVDAMGRTSVPGIWAAGDLLGMAPNLATAIATGASAGAALNHDLVDDDVRMAVADYSETFWEKAYQGRDETWAPKPNAAFLQVMDELAASDLIVETGSALEFGAGHGADSLWLAERGWQVVATDISATAVQRITARADAEGLATRLAAVRADITREFPSGSYDLICAAFTHLLENPDGAATLRRCLEALNPGGVLVLIDHGSRAPWMWGHGPIPTPADTVAGMGLDPADTDGPYRVVRADTIERTATGPNGEQAELLDNVVVIRKRDCED